MMIRLRILTAELLALVPVVLVLLMAGPARAGETCADLDGDGVAETCIEVDDEGAHFPGEPPPPVPDPGEGVPVDDSGTSVPADE